MYVQTGVWSLWHSSFRQYQLCFNRLINSKVMIVLPKRLFCRCWNTNMKQRAVIKCHAKLGKNASETFWLMQQVYVDDFLSRANVILWYKHFLKGRERLEHDYREERSISAMFITFFDSKEIIHREFAPTAQKITGAYYLEVLKRLMVRIRRIRPHIVRQFLARNQVCVLNHPPYSPDLTPCDFPLFPKLKSKLKVCFFNEISIIKQLQHDH